MFLPQDIVKIGTASAAPETTAAVRGDEGISPAADDKDDDDEKGEGEEGDKEDQAANTEVHAPYIAQAKAEHKARKGGRAERENEESSSLSEGVRRAGSPKAAIKTPIIASCRNRETKDETSADTGLAGSNKKKKKSSNMDQQWMKANEARNEKRGIEMRALSLHSSLFSFS